MKKINFEKMEKIEGGALTTGEMCAIGIGASIVAPSIFTFAIALTFCLSGDSAN